jgi:hypothetical protein
MKLLLRLFAVGSLLTATLAHAAGAFEGKVSLAISAGKNESQQIDYSIKDTSMRIDVAAEGQTISSIMDMKKMEMMILMPSEKMYMVVALKDTVEKAAKKTQGKEPDIEKTGRTDTILGYKCEEYVTKDKKNTTEIWIAEGLGTFMGLGNNSGGGMGGMFGGKKKAAEGWEEKFKGKPGFPLRVVTRDGKNKEISRMEATKIEPGSLPASLFQPPAGWQKFQMPSMGDMLKGFGG